jgi:Primase C terminal 2 (PriCT-2)
MVKKPLNNYVPTGNFEELRSLVFQLSAGIPDRARWNILTVIFNDTRGSKDGFELADEWCRTGKNYCGRRKLKQMWSKFELNHENPLTLRTLQWMIDQANRKKETSE